MEMFIRKKLISLFFGLSAVFTLIYGIISCIGYSDWWKTFIIYLLGSSCVGLLSASAIVKDLHMHKILILIALTLSCISEVILMIFLGSFSIPMFLAICCYGYYLVLNAADIKNKRMYFASVIVIFSFLILGLVNDIIVLCIGKYNGDYNLYRLFSFSTVFGVIQILYIHFETFICIKEKEPSLDKTINLDTSIISFKTILQSIELEFQEGRITKEEYEEKRKYIYNKF